MNDSYVFQTQEGAWRISGSTVSLDALVHAYWEGESPEAIAEDFPALTLEQIHGALAYYLRHRQDIDSYLLAQEQCWEQFRQESEANHGPLLQRLRASRLPAQKTEPLP